jgi:regulator of protease activity HflC (stomatin/prohibitin superfamily)
MTFEIVAWVLLAGTVAVLLAGFRRVPIGAAGIVIWLGRRTGEVRREGITWVLPWLCGLVILFRRERQIDVPGAHYYSSDRVRIGFKTTVRVAVDDPVALFDQGPGTYDPFRRDALGGGTGGEEANVALRGLVQNSIRESVQGMAIEGVLFGGGAAQALRERIRQELGTTVRRWGLQVPEVWLTDVEIDDRALQQAVQAEARESMAGKGHLAAWEAQIGKGALFQKVAGQVVEEMRRKLGREIPLAEVVAFLAAFYQNERAMDVALRAAGGRNEMMQLFYLQHLGLPLPDRAPLEGGGGVAPALGLPAPALEGKAREGVFLLGRDGTIAVEGDGVSRHHARLEVVGGRMVLTDLGSTNGSFVNGSLLPPNSPTPLGSADTLRLGRAVQVTTQDLAAATHTGTLRSRAGVPPR